MLLLKRDNLAVFDQSGASVRSYSHHSGRSFAPSLIYSQQQPIMEDMNASFT